MKSLMKGTRWAVAGTGLALLLATAISAQTDPRAALSVTGDRFLVAATERFLVLVSYFDGLNRPAAALARDLDWLRGHGVDGVRVWPNVRPPIMDAGGTLNLRRVESLHALIEAAAARGMVVDVSFHREGVCGAPADCGFTAGAFSRGVGSVASELSRHRNVLVDLQNEWDVYGGLALADLIGIRGAVQSMNPNLVVTASTTSGYGEGEAVRDAFDVVAFHGPRDSQGRWALETGDLVRRLRGRKKSEPARPIYLQEPNRFPLPSERRPEMDSNPEHYLSAASEAKLAGAGAWTFHTGACFDLSSGVPFADLLQTGEVDVLNRLSTVLAGVPWGAAAAADD
jgi:hypothetical protein